jgi:hypothetical protein
MVIVEDSKYLVSEKILIGQFFGLPEQDAFIELREPDTRTMMKMQKASRTEDTEQVVEAFIEVFPKVLVDHSLMKSEKEKMTAAEVIEVLEKKMELFMYVVTTYSEKVLFTLGKKKEDR